MAASNGSRGILGGGPSDANGGSEGPDFRALAMESESLLSHIARPDGIPRVHKSLAEIVSYHQCSTCKLTVQTFNTQPPASSLQS